MKRPWGITEKRGMGSLLGDLTLLATTIHDFAVADEISVWINAGGDVFMGLARDAPAPASNFFVGTYGLGITPSQIYEDLVAMRRERVADAIIF